jgi:glycosyltransferase involved in cell wall biosynthesis
MDLVVTENPENRPVPVAVVMIALNEAYNMEAVLNNISGWAQEIFLVDSYSTDATVDIALKRGVHVVQRAFRGFGDQWNFALKTLPISAPWTMKLDPDERLTPELKSNIRTAINQNEADAINMRRRLWFMGRPLPVRQELVRLWRTGSCVFSDVLVNEHPLVQGRIVTVGGDLEHHDSPNLHHWVEKQNRYSTVEALAAYHNSKLAADPRLFGTNLEKRMWLKANFWRVPFRYTIMFLYAFIALGAWRAGRVGFAWAWLRAELYRMRELKLSEMRIIGHDYDVPQARSGKPDPRVPQYESVQKDISDNDRGAFKKITPGTKVSGIKYHDLLAEGWDQRYSKGGFLRRSNYFIDKIVPLLNINGRWLDAGCGSGYFARLLCDYGAYVEGIDGSAEMIRVANHLAIPDGFF